MKKKKLPLWGALLLAALYLIFGLNGNIPEAAEPAPPQESIFTEATETLETAAPETDAAEATEDAQTLIDNHGSYTTIEDEALYLYVYHQLPENFITKNEARDLGWEGGGLEDYAPGMCIGGDRFGNYEGLLPDAEGRTWTECDIDTLGKNSRGAKRIVFSIDGLIYYTDDHYESFELLYDGFLQPDGE